MAYKPPKKPKPLIIDEYFGVNESVGETEIKLGESIRQRNFRITKNLKPQKREGHNTFVDTATGEPINKCWAGLLGGKDVLIYDSDNDLYEYNMTTEVQSVVGGISTVTDMFYFASKLYLLTGSGYYSYDGTTLSQVVPTIPVVEFGGEYDGVGAEPFQEINLLTDDVIVNRLGNGANNVFTLLFDVDSVSDVTVDEVVQTFTFTPPRTVTITSGTPIDNAIVDITCNLDDDQSASVTDNTRAVIFGPNESQVFLWGANNNTVRYSDLGDPTYFPVGAFVDVRTDEQPITDMKAIYDRLIAFKEDSADYTYAEFNPLYNNNNGLVKYTYDFFDLNDRYGSVSTAEVIQGEPFTLDGGAIQRWNYQSVVNNIDPKNISDRIRLSMESIDLSTAITYNYKKLKEYWFNIDDIVYIYNYGTDAYYMFDNIEAAWFLETEEAFYYGTKDGKIEKFEGLNDNGEVIVARLELAFTAFGIEEWIKNIFYVYMTIASANRTSLTIKYAADESNEDENESFTTSLVLFDYGDIDYGDWSYATNRNPQADTWKAKIKKFQWLKFIFENRELDETLTVLSLKVPVTTIKENK